MNPTTKLLVALLISAAALTAAPVAQANPGAGFTPDEIAYLSDVAGDGMRPAASIRGLVDEGWTICHALTSGMSIATAAGKVYSGSQTAVGVDGVTNAQAMRVVNHAIHDLCPSTTQIGNVVT
jgi:Protein of unknown function (DUF732)